MWTRKELKEQAKEALQRNYWKIVLVAALMLLLGGVTGTLGIRFEHWEVITQDGESEDETMDASHDEMEHNVGSGESGKKNNLGKIGMTQREWKQDMENHNISTAKWILAVVIGVSIFLIIFLVIFIFILAVDIFLLNPFSVGMERFMLKSVDDVAEVKEITYGFDHFYKNIVKTLFHRDLQVFLWTLLFIIPGIYKKYQYRMVSYIMAEYPDMEYKRALQWSRDMMEGHKWKAFVLDLSFILWHCLGMITCGIVEVFYVQPYQRLTCAALYRRINGTNENGMDIT